MVSSSTFASSTLVSRLPNRPPQPIPTGLGNGWENAWRVLGPRPQAGALVRFCTAFVRLENNSVVRLRRTAIGQTPTVGGPE